MTPGRKKLAPFLARHEDLLADIGVSLSIQCLECKHFSKKPITCGAFPKGIPKKILDGKFSHVKPYKGDHGIQFEPKDRHTKPMSNHLEGMRRKKRKRMKNRLKKRRGR
jgi:hypothetical protein